MILKFESQYFLCPHISSDTLLEQLLAFEEKKFSCLLPKYAVP